MASYLSRIVNVGIAINTSGTYASGAGVANGLVSAIHQFRNTTPVAIDTTVVNLSELRQSFSKTQDAVGRQVYKLTPGLVLMGVSSPTGPLPNSTTVAQDFRLGKILRMCGMSESITTTSSSLTYTFRSSAFEDGFVDCVLADAGGTTALRYKMKGVYGTCVIAGSAGQVITVDPTLTGLIAVQPSIVAVPASTFPPAGNTAQTMKSEGLSLTTSVTTYTGATALKFKSFSLDLGIDVQEDADANAADSLYGLLVAGRTPTLQLTVGCDSTNVADFHADMLTGAIQTIIFTHGSGVGRTCKFTCKGQIQSVTQTDDTGLRTLQIQYNLAVGGGLDESELTMLFG